MSKSLRLANGDRVGVVGSGPAGSFFTCFLLDIARRFDLRLEVDLYERKDFTQRGPAGCNHCGGIVSESLVQTLAAEGITLPGGVVKRGIDSYVMHTDEGRTRIHTLSQEMRIAAVHRGGGPKTSSTGIWRSFDGFLQGLALEKGARLLTGRVDEVRWADGRPQLKVAGGEFRTYDLVVVAAGVNTSALKLFESAAPPYRAPRTTKAYVSEYLLGHDAVERHVGSAMHMFLLNLPRLRFGAIIPKEDHVTVCILGDDIDPALVRSFLESPQVRACFPPGWEPPADHCHCSPRLDVGGAFRPYGDRLVFVGDAAIARLYKDGINAAFRTSKAAAVTAVCEGISAADFRRHYWPTCRSIHRDNRYGGVLFAVTTLIQRRPFARRGLLRMTRAEQARPGSRAVMSRILWDMFTGSASYRHVFLRTLDPRYIAGVTWNMARGLLSRRVSDEPEDHEAAAGGLGRLYHDGEVLFRQGDVGTCMYVVQEGQVEVIREGAGEVLLAVLSRGDVFGEMAIIDREVRSATVRARGEARILTVDKALFLKKVHEDPSLAFRTLVRLSHRIREMDARLARLEEQTPSRR